MGTDMRANYLAGVRDLVAWLEQHPDQQLPVSRSFNVPLRTNAAVEKWAADNGMSDVVRYDAEGNASASLPFGPVELHVYGYVDFEEHCDRTDGVRAQEYADKHGLMLVEQAPARPVEHVDYAEAAAVRKIEREMAIEAGDDSEIDRQVAEDDARFERQVWLANQAAKDAEARDDAWSTAEQVEHDQACEARIDAADAESEDTDSGMTAETMHAIFGEPVEGRDYTVMPPMPEGGVR